jgi:hypothetical protein
MATDNAQDTWLSSWPDVVAFVAVLAIAWWMGWNAGDLVWSLWLSSLVVGYFTIVWMIGQPALEIARISWKDRGVVSKLSPRALMWFWVALLAGALFLLAFFTIHFGMFHYIHSQFLISFFPVDAAGAAGHSPSAGMSTYIEIARRYWPALPSAFLAHRAAFRKPLSLDGPPSMGSLAGANKFGNVMTEPYRNVIRMHVLIFFFAAAHFAKLENFAVYTVVYAVYFFPWRLLRRPAPVGPPGVPVYLRGQVPPTAL